MEHKHSDDITSTITPIKQSSEDEKPQTRGELQENNREFQVMVYNVGKRTNIGNMVRSAVAFGCKSLIVIGDRKLQSFGNQGTIDYLKHTHFDTIQSARDFLHSKGFKIVGVEIRPDAKDVTTHPFPEKTVFMFGSEGIGMSQTQIDHCDSFIYIPQYGKGTASLNVSNAAAIVMHHFAVWAGFKQHAMEESKFVVDPDAKIGKRRLREGETWEYSEEDILKQAERAARRKAAMEEQESKGQLTDESANGDSSDVAVNPSEKG